MSDTPTGGEQEEQDTCPRCGSINIRAKHGGRGGERKYPGDYCCKTCKNHFDTPERTVPEQGNIPPNTGMASKLYKIGKERDKEAAE